MKVLIVDDNDENRYVLEVLIKGEGHQVLSAHNGLEAMDLLKSSGAGLIISDILMPGMDGFQLCRAVRGDEGLRNIPFVFYTATYVSDKDRDFALSLGADRFFVKPDDIELLSQTIKKVLADHPSTVEHPLGDEMEFFRQHNNVLFRKLEKKVADLEEAKQAFQASLRQMGAILNNIPDIAWLKDTESRFIAVNASFGEACGRNPKDLEGKTDLDIWPEDLANLYRGDDREVMSTKHRKRMEERLVGPDGKESWIETIKTPIFDLEGNVIGTTGIARDITERKHIEKERASLEEQLRQAQKMEAIGQFAGGVAHDFNNILTAIIGYASIALDEMAADDLNRHNIEQVMAAANRGTVLTQSLLAFGRKQAISLASIDLNEVVLKFEKFLLRLLREDVALKTSISPHELRMIADRGQIEQVLMNLVTNARDAMPKGGRIVVETGLVGLDAASAASHGLDRAGAYALLAVRDSGVGITDDVKRKIFEPFFTTKEEGQGTGLGLAVVFGIVKQHKGCIEVFASPGAGTTFNIYLPLDQSAKEAEGQKAPEQYPLRGGSETVLVAEDDAALRQLAAAMLRDCGYTVIEAIDGLDAVAKFAANREIIRLVVLDGIMPKMNGKNAWQEIKALRPDIKAIFISGYPEKVFTKDGIPDEKVVFIPKPYSRLAFLQKIREVLDG